MEALFFGLLILVPIMPMVMTLVFVIRVRNRPRVYWSASVGLCISTLPFFFVVLYVISGSAAAALAGAAALLFAMLCVVFDNGVDMQSLERARVSSRSAQTELRHRATSIPTRFGRAFVRKRAWDRYVVTKGCPEEAYFARLRATSALRVVSIVAGGLVFAGPLIGGLRLVWAAPLAVLAGCTLLVRLAQRRLPVAGELEVAEGLRVLQVLDAIEPRLVTVPIEQSPVAVGDDGWAVFQLEGGGLVLAKLREPVLSDLLITAREFRRALWAGSVDARALSS